MKSYFEIPGLAARASPNPYFKSGQPGRSRRAVTALLAPGRLSAMLLLRFGGSNTHASDHASCIPPPPCFIIPADYAGAAAAASGVACHEGVRARERARSSASLKIV